MSRKSHLAIARSHADEALSRTASNIDAAETNVVIAAGTTTLVLGVSPAVLVPGIPATARVLFSLSAANASTALGTLRPVVTANTGFVVTSLQDGTPGATQTGDLGTYNYVVVAPN